MITRIRAQLTYANLMATVAVFIALGGGAWALAKNSVDSKAIENGTVRSQELKNDDVRGGDIEANAVQGSDVADGAIGGADVADGAISGADIADNSVASGEVAAESLDGSDVADDGLTVNDIDESTFSFVDVPIGGVLSAQARGIGGDGDTTFGPLSGRAAAGAIEEVRMAFPSNTLFGGLHVFLADDLDVGESRTFTVMLQVSGSGTPFASNISCTITAGRNNCSDSDADGSGALMAALRIESSGATLNANDDAYIGLIAKSNLSP
jgi:hypothetical protein